VYDTTEPSQLIERTKNADIIITNSTKLNADFFAIAPALQGVMVLSTGFNAVDTVAARSRNIPVCNVSSYSTDAVAQGVFALLLELTNRTGHHAAAVRSGRWSGSSDFCFWDGEHWGPEVEAIDWSSDYDEELVKLVDLVVRECASLCDNHTKQKILNHFHLH